MNAEFKQIEFDKLRFAYETVKEFLETQTGDKVEFLKTKIVDDLGMTGDDNYFMLAEFVKKFELDYEGFDYDKHFYSEAELYDSTAALINLLSLSIMLPLKAIQLLSLNKVHIPKPGFYKPSRKVTDMTFKDLLTWYLEGRYTLCNNVKYKIKNAR